MYVIVLATASLVMVIGLTGLSLTRLHVKTAAQTNDWMEAWVLAEAAAEQALVELDALTVNGIPIWRIVYTSGVDAFTGHLGRGTLSWRLIDEIDNNLANDEAQPVRLYGIGQVGQAVRVSSVLLQRVGTGSNLLQNGDIETGASQWDGDGCSLSIETVNLHGGLKSLEVKNRNSSDDGPRQDVRNAVTNGTIYVVEVWVKMKIGTDSALIAFEVEKDGNTAAVQGLPVPVNDTGWTKVTAAFTTAWPWNSLSHAWLRIETTTGTADFYIDDAVMQAASPRLNPAPSSRRWAMMP